MTDEVGPLVKSMTFNQDHASGRVGTQILGFRKLARDMHRGRDDVRNQSTDRTTLLEDSETVDQNERARPVSGSCTNGQHLPQLNRALTFAGNIYKLTRSENGKRESCPDRWAIGPGMYQL
jgi:hypothetical protein